MFGIGVQEMMFLAVLALLVFGPKRLPELARTLGKGMAEFRRASADLRGALSLEPDPKLRTPRTRRQEEAADPRTDRDYQPSPSQAVGGPEPEPASGETGATIEADAPSDASLEAARAAEAAVQAELADEANDERHRDEAVPTEAAGSAAQPAQQDAAGEPNGIARNDPARTGRTD